MGSFCLRKMDVARNVSIVHLTRVWLWVYWVFVSVRVYNVRMR